MTEASVGSRLVHIRSFPSKSLGNERGLTIYLPPQYDAHQERRYPVLYLHDGQQVFESSPFSGSSWHLRETTDQLIASGRIQPIIMVGIYNQGLERLNEFAHPTGESGIEGASDIDCRGERYEQFLVHELKPYIDQSFRTLSGREHTALLGSSMGGLITYHIGFRNPDVFSMLGMMSPYFIRLDLNSMREIAFYNKLPYRKDMLVWMDIGEAEANILVRHVRSVAEELIGDGFVPGQNLMYYEVPGAAHTESDWAFRVKCPLLYFFGEVGKPVSVELYGRKVLGLMGMTVKANPVVTFDSGFVMTSLSGAYTVRDAGLLTVGTDGTIVPHELGDTEITHSQGAVSCKSKYAIIPRLEAYVRLHLQISVPKETKTNGFVFVGRLAVPLISEQVYGGIFSLPRDIVFRFKITTDTGIHESNSTGTTRSYRMLRVDEDMEVQYEVEAWEKR
ncbi:alpha/beta hydrolase [Paenibacillus sp. SI8]|uniref:alpha/beta hydrolase n=1 Tax=unclassified Paenibacillus TaxID=185978 RepID=UPI0034652D7A